MIKVGRLIVKLAGRDAGLKVVIVDILEEGYILVDGQVRRRKCNILHVEPLDKIIKIKKGASHEEIVEALKTIGVEVKKKKKKDKVKTEKPKKQRKANKKPEVEEETPVEEKKKVVRKAEEKA